MDPRQLFMTAMDAADGGVRSVRDDELTNATPCTDWDLRALIQHMTYELLWLPDMLAGKTVAEVGAAYEGDILGEDFQASWQAASAKAREAVEAADLEQGMVHTSFGDIPAREYMLQIAGDMYIHCWDAEQAIQCNLRFDPDATQVMYEYYKPEADKWRGAILGAEVAVSADARLADRLLGLLGRTPSVVSTTTN
jgi:uncharacterized protein (TIGR03086 family)